MLDLLPLGLLHQCLDVLAGHLLLEVFPLSTLGTLRDGLGECGYEEGEDVADVGSGVAGVLLISACPSLSFRVQVERHLGKELR